MSSKASHPSRQHKNQYKRSLVWIRRDLRLHDHRALFEACARSKSVIPVFVFDELILSKISPAHKQLHFMLESLKELQKSTREFGGKLIFLHGDPKREIPKFAKEQRCDAVFFNEDYQKYAKHRDHHVCKELKSLSITAHSFKDHVVFNGGEILKTDRTPYQVFSAYKKRWLAQISKAETQDYTPDFSKLTRLRFKNSDFPAHHASDLIIVPGPSGGSQQLLKFSKNLMSKYDQTRDIPSIDGTSMLSAHLRLGTVSIRECVRATQKITGTGSATWLNELIWRDFYQMILDQFPHVERQNFKAQYQGLKWPGQKRHFKLWCEGKTGYPIVDAAMRQLVATGWMHNRLRMIVASFLVKDLHIDWRLGERFFADHLIDYDLAANNGGWQWSASTGTDAQPYFRVFNPLRQSERFDPDGKFIRQWCPEYDHLDRKALHQAHDPIVDHTYQKTQAIKLFNQYSL